MNLLAIDLGTQSIRAAILNEKGKILGFSQLQHSVESPKEGWAHQFPNMWWNNACQVIQTVIQKTSIPVQSLEGVCVCGQMYGPVGVKENGDTITNQVQLWCDKRCQDQCETIRHRFNEEELIKLTANPITAGWSGFKIRWIKENNPQEYKESQFFLTPKDYINFKLTGVAATDYTEASGSYLWDSMNNQYSEIMAKVMELDLLKLPPALE